MVLLGVARSSAGCACADVAGSRQDGMAKGAAAQTLVVVSYMPVALFAEDLRVQNTLLLAVLRRRDYVPTPMTGCVKDVRRLWNMRECELYGELDKGLPYTVASLRHGNAFPLVNMQVLRLGGLLESGRRPAMQHRDFMYRATVVNVSFMFAGSDGAHGCRARCMYHVANSIQLVALVAVTAVCALYGLGVCALMMACMLFNWAVLMAVHHRSNPVFGKAASRASASRDKVPGGATLDTHVVMAHANADEINVLCGYSSQLH